MSKVNKPSQSQHSPWGVIGHDLAIEVPEYVGGGLGGVGDDAGQVDGGASVDVEVGVALYPHMGHCNGGQGEARPRLLRLLASTYDVEGDGVGLGRLGGDLALVDAGVPLLDELDEQHPLVLRVVAGGEPRVRGEALLARRQNVHVPVPHPRHLHRS